MKKAILMACLMAGILGGAMNSHAYVVNFESLAHNDDQIASHGASYVENGYLFTNTATVESSGFEPSFSTLGAQVYGYSGSTALINDNWAGQTVLTRVGGGTFNLTSITLSSLYPAAWPDNTPFNVLFHGTLSNGATVSETFNVSGNFGPQVFSFCSDFTNIVSANWEQTPYAHQFDNVDVTPTTPTPIPAAAWLLGSGLLGLVGIRRKNA